MNYRFTIQASRPRCTTHFDADDASLSDAMETVFPLESEYAIVTWNWIYVPITYKYDLSVMIEDVLALLEAMLSEPRGERTIQWPSNTFAATWNVVWSGPTTTVDAVWTSVLGGTETLLADKPKISLETRTFIEEWKRPLEVIASALVSAGYGPGLAGLQRLQTLANRIDRAGILYRD